MIQTEEKSCDALSDTNLTAESVTPNENTIDQINDQTDNNNDTSDSDEKELAELMEQKKLLEKNETDEKEAEEKLKREIEQHIEDAHNNINIFTTWMETNQSQKQLYKCFGEDFSVEYRSALFENICEFFKDDTFVTDNVIFYWKVMVVNLLSQSKKYKSYIDNLVLDTKTKETNIRLVKEKYIFRCFIDDEHLCYFKENGNDYYVS